MNAITPCSWFDGTAEEAAKFYTSVFKDSEILDVSYYGEGAPMPAGTVLTIRFRLGDFGFLALNGGPNFKFTEATSFMIDCGSQEDVDYYWDALTEGGEPGPCGWLKDKFGLSWQVVPSVLGELLNGEDPERSSQVMQALMQMGKLDISKLQDAYNAA